MAAERKIREGAYPAIPKARESPTTSNKRKRYYWGSNHTYTSTGLLSDLKARETILENDESIATKKSKNSNGSVTKRGPIAAKADSNLIPVGIDLGATFSGVAYAPSVISEPEDVVVCSDWPAGGAFNQQQVKVKTILAYPEENPGNQKVKTRKFGSQVFPGMKSCSLFKIKFDDAARSSKYDDPLLKKAETLARLPPGKSAKEVAADFLKCVNAHILKTLGDAYTKEMLSVTRILWILTVPAFWSNKAKEITKEAAREAGITTAKYRRRDKIMLVTEPEAAALSVLTARRGPYKFEAKTSMLIVDAGGLTVDLCVYQILRIEPELKLDEAVVGTGAKCGSTAINRAVLRWMAERFGTSFSSLPIEKIGDGSKFMNEVEKEKQDFDGTDDGETIRLGLKMPNLKQEEDKEQYYDFDEGDVLLPRSEFKKFFKACSKSIIGLIGDQLKDAKESKTIVLVGGFGNSILLYNEVLAFCQTQDNLQLIKPENGWSAIVKGAAIKGLRKSWIASVKGRQHLGISVHRAFRDENDDEINSFNDPILGKRVMGYFHQLVAKGETLKPSTTKKVEVSFVLSEEDFAEDPVWVCKLYSSTADDAPERVDDIDVEEEGAIEVDVSKMDLDWTYEAETEAGEETSDKYAIVNCTVAMALGRNEGTIGVASIVNRRRCGETTIRYTSGGTLDEAEN